MATALISSNSHSLVEQFVVDAREDYVSPTTSVFFNRIHSYRQHVQLLYDNLDFDVESLHKFRRSVKALHESGSGWHESERDLVGALDGLANVNAANALTQDCDPEISAAWLKFCVIFNDLSKLTKGLVQSVKNNLLFPVENLLKNDMKDKSELKKPVDKALKDFDAKIAKLEKDLKHSSREGANGRLCLSSTDLAEAMLKERTALELEMSKYFHTVSKIHSKKGSELLQHLIAFYHTQESFYREGLQTVGEFRCYVETLIDQLNDINRKQEEERKQLRKLSELLETSSCLKDNNEKLSTPHSFHSTTHDIGLTTGGGDAPREQSSAYNNGQAGNSQLRPAMDTYSGHLYKKSNRRMHRHWMKRKCEVKNDRFYISHSNETMPPQEINLLTCRVVPHKQEAKEFYVISYERKYHFQADDQTAARHWVTLLKRNQDAVQNRTFLSDQPGCASSDPETHRGQLPSAACHNVQKLIVEKIRSLPGNDRCCDCSSDKDVSWVSTSLGSLHCIDCSGGHRDLGCHVSRIHSLTLDNLDNASVLVPLSMGNKAVNEIFEGTPNAAREKLPRNSSGSIRKSYINKKYSEKKFLLKLDEPLESYLLYAVTSGCVKKTLHALALGANANILHPEFQETPLFVAIRRDCDGSHLACIQLLVQNGADVNKVNADGDTPMHLCIRLNKPDCLKLVLLSRNADVKTFRSGLNELASRLDGKAVELVLSKAVEGDRNALEDIAIPGYLLQSLGQPRGMYFDSDEASFTSSTISVTGSSPRLVIQHSVHMGHAPPPPPARSKPRMLSLYGDMDYYDTHKRSASDSARGCDTLPAARLVLPASTPASLTKGIRNGGRADSAGGHSDTGGKETVGLDKNEGVPVELADVPPPIPPRKHTVTAAASKLRKRCRALYDCHADQADELSFKAKDVIIVTDDKLPNEDANWMEGYLENDPQRKGVFPVTFVTFET